MPELEVAHRLPQFTQPLPALSHEERTKAMQAVRAVKGGRLYVCRFNLHQKKSALKLEWSEDGGAQLC